MMGNMGPAVCLLVLVVAAVTGVCPAQTQKEGGAEKAAGGGHAEALAFKEHPIRVGDGKGGWRVEAAESQVLHCPIGVRLMPFGAVQMDNGEVMLLASSEAGKQATPVAAFSRDRGDTWTEWAKIQASGDAGFAKGRPMMLMYLGKGRVTFNIGSSNRYFSDDYGRTWEKVQVCYPRPEDALHGEGNMLVDRDAEGNATRIAAIGYKSGRAPWPEPYEAFVQWSRDGGRTWGDEVKPSTWTVEYEHKGRKVVRGASEGSIVRARNGDLVAALRTDMPPRYYLDGGRKGADYDDGLEGLGVSVSKDDGKIWSPIRLLYEAGRHHAHLLLMPNGDVVMTYIVRVDVRDGRLASYQRGCEALVSRDNGQTWDPAKRYVLDAVDFLAGKRWFSGETGHLCSTLLGDGRVLTAYGKYVTGGACLIRWRP